MSHTEMSEAISTVQQGGSGMSDGMEASNNRSTTCNGSDNYNGLGLARVGQPSPCLSNIDITTLSNMRRSVSMPYTSSDRACVERDENTSRGILSKMSLDSLHIKNGRGPLNELVTEASNALITPPPSEAGSHTEEVMEDVKGSPCICDRPVSHVVCLQCRKHFLGHAVRVCPQHPRRINLMDIAVCPNAACRGSQLEERSRPPSPVAVADANANIKSEALNEETTIG